MEMGSNPDAEAVDLSCRLHTDIDVRIHQIKGPLGTIRATGQMRGWNCKDASNRCAGGRANRQPLPFEVLIEVSVWFRCPDPLHPQVSIS